MVNVTDVALEKNLSVGFFPQLRDTEMANVSDWKGWEWEVARALGGKRFLRTQENMGLSAPDVYFPVKEIKRYPRLAEVVVECKKKKSFNIPAEFAIAKGKYQKIDKKTILAVKIPRKEWLRRKTQIQKALRLTKKQARGLNFSEGLVTVDLMFFGELFAAWKEQPIQRFPRGKK